MPRSLRPSRILLGVCGGVAAYKAAELLRVLQRQGHEVRVMMTEAAARFVQPLTFRSLSGHRVCQDLWTDDASQEDGSIEHIAMAQWADLVVLAPVTAHTLARLAHGMADDFVTCACLATEAPLLLAPAMNVNMWRHPATQANLQLLVQRGCQIVQPEPGYLACGMTGDGRLAEPETIALAADALLTHRIDEHQDLIGETVLITAGGTREPVDAVRFLGNRSSGKMGYALALAAKQRGARVVLISAPTALDAPRGCERIDVTTAAEMQAAVLLRLAEATIVIKAAAVADFRAKHTAPGKLERSGMLTLELEPTADIARMVSERRAHGTLLIAFAAEAGRNIERARHKLLTKGADAIVLNDILRDGTGFDAERNAGVFLTPDGETELPETGKAAFAHRLLDEIARLRTQAAAVHREAALTSER